jgi:hypothetical protein
VSSRQGHMAIWRAVTRGREWLDEQTPESSLSGRPERRVPPARRAARARGGSEAQGLRGPRPACVPGSLRLLGGLAPPGRLDQ